MFLASAKKKKKEMLLFMHWTNTDTISKQNDKLKKEFTGPGLHLRPVHADRAWPPLQWTLRSVWCLWKQWQKDKTHTRQKNLEDHTLVTDRLRENTL